MTMTRLVVLVELVRDKAYSKPSYYSLVLNGKADKNLRIDSGAMILAVTSLVRIVRRTTVLLGQWWSEYKEGLPGAPSGAPISVCALTTILIDNLHRSVHRPSKRRKKVVIDNDVQ